MKTLIATLILIAGPLAAHPFHAEPVSVAAVGGAFVLLAAILLIAKRANLGKGV